MTEAPANAGVSAFLARAGAAGRHQSGSNQLIVEVNAVPTTERITVELAGKRLLVHREAQGRKRSTLVGYRSALRTHLVPFFGDRPLDRITHGDVEGFIAWMSARKRAAQTTLHAVHLLHSIFDFAQAPSRRWTTTNPCKYVDKPVLRANGGIRYLDPDEVEALIAAVPVSPLGRVDRALYLTAAMTGLRRGELLALRWEDVDWTSRRIRVRRAWVRGELSAPKSRRASRSVPLADRVAGELERLFQASEWQADGDLVFAHPHTGKPLDPDNLYKRFKGALRAARVREVRFHDLRHTFATRMAAAGAPMRSLQEWMGHSDFKTTLIYADYQPSEREAELIEDAFASGVGRGPPRFRATPTGSLPPPGRSGL